MCQFIYIFFFGGGRRVVGGIGLLGTWAAAVWECMFAVMSSSVLM